MIIIQKIKSKIPNYLKDLLGYIIFVFIFYYLPIWLTIFAMYLTGNLSKINKIWDTGGLFIYSTAILASSFYDTKEYSEKGQRLRLMRHVSIFLLGLSVVGFIITTILSDTLSSSLSTQAVIKGSIVINALSLFIMFYFKYFEMKAGSTDPDDVNRRMQNDIKDGLETV